MESSAHREHLPAGSSRARAVLRLLCLLTAVANAGGSVVLVLFYRPIFEFLGAPLPPDMFSFTAVSAFSFGVGVLSYIVFRDPERSTNLLVVGIVSKALYALVTWYFHDQGMIPWIYLAFGAWDGLFTVIFCLFFIHLVSPDLAILNAGTILPGVARARNERALLLHYSLTGNSRGALRHVEQGLRQRGYAVDTKAVVADEPLFHFPFSLWEFLRITYRAILRRPAAVEPLGIAADHPYDLIVVGGQTWFVGMAGPLEAVFQSPANRPIFRGRDVAVVNVSRGLWRRSQAMIVRWLERSGANVVGARAYTNPGWEPARTFSLFLFLACGEEGRPRWLRGWFLQQQYLSERRLEALVRFGEALAERPRCGERPIETGDVSG